MKRIQLWDGDYTKAYIVREFKVAFSSRLSTSVETVSAKLSLEDVGNNREWFWGDDREIAWATAAADANTVSVANNDTVIDPDHIVVEDLFIGAYSYTDTEEICYLIVLEAVDVSEFEGTLAIINQKA